MRLTMSVCPVCYAVIPATVAIEGDEVWMTKVCKKHGAFRSMVERDRRWYERCEALGHTGMYKAYFIDVTDQCNLKCKYCYKPKGETFRGVDEVVEDAWSVKGMETFILSGGEPTLHPDLHEIVRRMGKFGKPMVLTNGIRMVEEEGYLESLVDAGLRDWGGGSMGIGLSFHLESNGRDFDLLDVMRSKGWRLATTLFVVDQMDQIEDAVEVYNEYRDVIASMRIRSACNLWGEDKAKGRIYVSDMIKFLGTMGHVEILEEEGNKVSYAPMKLSYQGNCMDLRLVSWYDVNNVDLWDIDCPPLYRDDKGVLRNFVTAAIRNEGLRNLEGVRVRRGILADVPDMAKMWMSLVKEDMNGVGKPDPAAWIAQTVAMLGSPDYYLFVSEDKGNLVGFMDGVVSFDPSTSQKVMTGRHIYVNPEYRKTGATERMHREGVKLARSLGVKVFKRKVLAGKKPVSDKKVSELILQVRI